MNTQRQVMYDERMKVLRGESVHEDILKLIPDYVADVASKGIDNAKKPELWDIDKLNRIIEERLLPPETNFVTAKNLELWDYDFFMQKLTEKVIECYEEKIEKYKEMDIDFGELERMILLRNVDKKWIDHIDDMDKLKRGISLRAYGNEDPINAYKKEGLEMFEAMTASIQEDTVSMLLKVEINTMPQKEEKKEYRNIGGSSENNGGVTVRKAQTVGRNDPCPCGSGKKYKNCCGR